MALSPKDILSALQWEFLSCFFQGAVPFFLTGGTALSAFYLRHRYSEDLDLFTLDGAAFDRVSLYVADTAAKLRADAVSLQTAPLFHRYRITRDADFVVVDFIKEVVPQVSQEKNRFEGIVVDTLADITANKVCTSNMLYYRTDRQPVIDWIMQTVPASQRPLIAFAGPLP